MKKFTISVLTTVEAENEQEAVKIASERPLLGLCYECAGGNSDEEWITSGELDGEVCKKVCTESDE